MRQPICIILDALKAGQKIKFKDLSYEIKMSEDGVIYLCGKILKYNSPKEEDCPLGFNMDINEFIKECNEFTAEELWIISTQTVMQNMVEEKRGKT